MNRTQNNQQQEKKVDDKTLFWNRLQLILIVVVFAAPIVGAYFYKPSKVSHYGDLYSPVRQVSNLQMQNLDGEAVELDSFRRQWIFLVVADGKCSQACEENLLKIRQLRFMQNNNMLRIRTVFLHSQLPAERAADLAKKYSPVESYRVPYKAYDEWAAILRIAEAPAAAQRDRFYIIDPAGNLVISYPATMDPNLIKKDIKRLLKTSQIG